jgi:hypothetical protein
VPSVSAKPGEFEAAYRRFQALSNRIDHIRPLVPRAIAALQEMALGTIRIISS